MSTPPAVAGLGPIEFFDPRAFLSEVKEAFADEPEQYKTFIETMRDFGRSGGEPQVCIEQLGQIFQTRKDLIGSLNKCLPEGYRIDPENPTAKLQVPEMPIDPATGKPRTIAPAFKFGSAHEFISKAKEAFTDEPEKYRDFLAAMRKLRSEPEQYDQVMQMLEGHEDLRTQFEEILPKEHLALFGKYQANGTFGQSLPAPEPQPGSEPAQQAEPEPSDDVAPTVP